MSPSEMHRSNMQSEIAFDDATNLIQHLPPRGYTGFSGFHKYWGKKPTEGWRFLIQNFSDKSDTVLDPFLGSGLIAAECIELERRLIAFDINPISIELANLFINPPSHTDLKIAVNEILSSIRPHIKSLYGLPDGRLASHFLWVGEEISRVWTLSGRKRVEVELEKSERNQFKIAGPYNPQRLREIKLFDNSRINSSVSNSLNDIFTSRALQSIDLIKEQIDGYDENLQRALLLILTASAGQMSKMVFAVTRRGKSKGIEISSDKVEVGSWSIGYWKPHTHFEINAMNCFENKAKKLLNAVDGINRKCLNNETRDLKEFFHGNRHVHIELGDSSCLLKTIPSGAVKLVIADPPHGDRIPYLELSELWNTIIDKYSDFDQELVVSNAKGRNKSIKLYNAKLADIFCHCSRVLTDDGVLAVIFNSRSKEHWSTITNIENATGLQFIGCYDLAYSSGSVVQDSRPGGLKSDFVLLYGKDPSKSINTSIMKQLENTPGWSKFKPSEMV